MVEHIVPRKIYFITFGLLITLTMMTWRIALIDLGPLNTIVALTIAVTKALMVALFFMHLRYSRRIMWAVIGGGLLWLLILIALTMNDYLTRGWVRYPS